VIHARAVSPSEVTSGLVGLLSSRSGVLNVIVLDGVARNPEGDAVQFDMINAEANDAFGLVLVGVSDARRSTAGLSAVSGGESAEPSPQSERSPHEG
jgi:hypothetical protein